MTAILVFDTATEQMNIALAIEGREWLHQGAGAAQASAALIPAIRQMLSDAGVRLEALHAIAYGRGPGAFTGLRTACSVAQGLAFGAGLPVVGVDTLQAVAEDARIRFGANEVWVTMDARMNEIYAAHYRYEVREAAGAHQRWHVVSAPALHAPESLNECWEREAPIAVAGNALAAFAGRLNCGAAAQFPDAAPNPQALLALALSAFEDGEAVDASLALPLYVRDKVALTTIEREAVRAQKAAASAAGPA